MNEAILLQSSGGGLGERDACRQVRQADSALIGEHTENSVIRGAGSFAAGIPSNYYIPSDSPWLPLDWGYQYERARAE